MSFTVIIKKLTRHASSTHSNIALYIPDTHVFVIPLAKSIENSAHLFILTCTKNARRIIDVDAVANCIHNKLNKTNCDKEHILLGYHCISDCDSISSFTGRDKKILYLMCTTRISNVVPGEVAVELHKFVCHMYGRRPTNSGVNSNSTR